MSSELLNNIKKDISLIPFGIKLIVFVIFLRSFGWGFADPFYSIYLYQFKEDYTIVGLLASIVSVSALISIIPLMKLGDKMDETIIVSDGELLYFFVIISYVIAGIFKSIPLLIITLFFSGIAQTFVVVGTEIYIRKYGAPGKTRPFAFYVGLDYFGWFLGMLIAAFTVQYYSFNTMFLFIIPSIIASFFILPRIHVDGLKSLIMGIRQYFHSSKDVFNIFGDFKELNPKVIFFLVLAFFDGVIRMFSYVFIPLFGLSMNMSFKSIALLMAAMYFPFALSFLFTEILEKYKKMNVLAVGLFIGAVSFILLYFVVNRFWIFLLAAAISLSMAIIRPAYNGAITRLTPRRMLGEVTGFNNFIERIGRVLGPILTGIIADIYGLQTTFLLIAVIAFGLGAVSLILRGYDFLISPKEPIFTPDNLT